MTDRDVAWESMLESLPPRWRLGRGTYDAARRTYSVSAVGPNPGPDAVPEIVTGTGPDVTSALLDLDARLRAVEPDPGGEDWQLARLAFVTTAEEWSRATMGRPLTHGELRSLLLRYRGR